VDFSQPTTEHLTAPSSVAEDHHAAKPATDTPEKPEPKDAAIDKYDFDSYDGKLYRIFEGSVFEGVVTNHIDGGLSGPILIMLTTDYYSHDHQQLLLPQGTRLIGSVQAVNSSQARKMVVSFHRAICPDGFSVDLDKFAGLDPLGTTGLATKVDNRYFQTFAVAAAIGGLGGLAQIGNNNILDPSAQIRNGVTSQTSEEGEQILNHFLNRLPIITLKEGSRARVYIGRDILIPSYAEHRVEPAM
jgi:type IV secretion system protein VirB10